MSKFENGDVVQFTNDGSLKGCIGVIKEIKNNADGIAYTISFRSPINNVIYYKIITDESMIAFIGKSRIGDDYY